MCWVAVDRALRLSRKRFLPAPETEWQQCRDAIYETIMEEGRNAFALISAAYNLDRRLDGGEG